jgi:uncharacterized protein
MKIGSIDIKLVLGIMIAHLLLFFTFQDRAVFWYIFTASMLFLISYSIMAEEVEDEASFRSYLFYGAVSGILLYGLFWTGHFLIEILNLPFASQIGRLYSRLSPEVIWHYIVLILIIIPGEEIFWRGFVQKRLQSCIRPGWAVPLAALLYASVHFYSGYPVLALAALAAGLFWGYLYAWKKSLPLVIVSHLIFDLLIFVILPLN